MGKSLGKNAIANTAKTLCQVLFPLITIPYVARVLGTDNYGKVNFTASIIGYFVLFAAFGIGNYATREGARVRENKMALNTLVNELYTINWLTSILSIAGLLVVAFGLETRTDYKILFVVQGAVIVFTALGADWINSIFEDYTYIAIRYVIVQLASLLLLFLFVRNCNDYVVYATITTIANSGANAFNFFYIRKYARIKPCFSRSTFKHLKPMFVLVGYSFAITIYVNSDTTLLGLFKDEYDVGVYSLAAKIYLVIKQVLNASIVVALPRISLLLGKHEDREYKKILSTVLGLLIALVLPAMVGLFALSEEVVAIAGDVGYENASLPLRILSISLCFAVFACYYANCILLPHKKDKSMFYATLAGCIANLVLNLFIIPKCSYVGTALTTLIAEIIVFTMCYIKSRNIERVKINPRDVFSVLVGCTLIALVCVLSKMYLSSIIIRTIIAVMLSVVVYFCCLILLKNSAMHEQVLPKIKSRIKK